MRLRQTVLSKRLELRARRSPIMAQKGLLGQARTRREDEKKVLMGFVLRTAQASAAVIIFWLS